MKEVITELIKSNLGPLVFLVLAGALCWLLPEENSVEAIYLVIGGLTNDRKIFIKHLNKH